MRGHNINVEQFDGILFGIIGLKLALITYSVIFANQRLVKAFDSILPWLFLNPTLVSFEVFEKEF